MKNLLLERQDSILTITINRGSKLNALNQDTLAELRKSMDTVYEEDEIRGVIVTGAGEKAFVAGADISEFVELSDINARKFAENGQEVFQLIEDCHTPVVAVVNGFALGGGCELAMACHMRVATQNAKFGQPEVNLGIVPGYGGTQRLTKLIGKGRSFEYSMTTDMINAMEALNFGLVNHVLDSKENAMNKAFEILTKISQKAPVAIEMLVDCINTATGAGNGFQVEANAFAKCCATKDFKEGAAAFLEKRKPNFSGN